MRTPAIRTLLLLPLAACGMDDDPLVWLDPTAASAGRVLAGIGSPPLPVRLEPGESVSISGPEGLVVDPGRGELAAVTEDEQGEIAVEYLEIGADVDADALAVAGAREAVVALAREAGEPLARRADGVWEISGRDALYIAADFLDSGRIVSSWPLAPLAGIEEINGDLPGEADLRAIGTVGGPGSLKGERGGAGPAFGIVTDGRGLVEGTIAEAGMFGSVAAFDLGPLVGLYEDEAGCLLIDAAGTWSTCERGLGRVLGTVSRDGDAITLASWDGEASRYDWVDDGSAWTLVGKRGSLSRGRF